MAPSLCEDADNLFQADESSGEQDQGEETAPRRGKRARLDSKAEDKGKGRASPKRKTRGAAPSSSKSGRQSGKGKRYCRGCGKFLPANCFPLAQALCADDKRANDNLKGFATRQGQKEWFEKASQDEARFQQLLQTYKTRCPDKGGTPRGKFACLEYIEEFEASVEVLQDQIGEMMNETEFYEFCFTTKGGKLSLAAAQLKWQTMVQTKKDLVHDWKSEDGSIRFRVTVKDQITFRNTHRTVKKMALRAKAIKALDADAISKMQKDVMSGSAIAGQDQNMMDVAKLMAGSGGGVDQDSFDGVWNHADLGANVRELLSSSSEEEEEEEQEEGNNAEEHEADGSELASPHKKKRPEEVVQKAKPGEKAKKDIWFDREAEVDKAQRGWLTGLDTLKVSFEGALVEASDVLLAVQPSRGDPLFRAVFSLLESRTIAGKIMVHGEDSELRLLVAAAAESKPLPIEFARYAWDVGTPTFVQQGQAAPVAPAKPVQKLPEAGDNPKLEKKDLSIVNLITQGVKGRQQPLEP